MNRNTEQPKKNDNISNDILPSNNEKLNILEEDFKCEPAYKTYDKHETFNREFKTTLNKISGRDKVSFLAALSARIDL